MSPANSLRDLERGHEGIALEASRRLRSEASNEPTDLRKSGKVDLPKEGESSFGSKPEIGTETSNRNANFEMTQRSNQSENSGAKSLRFGVRSEGEGFVPSSGPWNRAAEVLERRLSSTGDDVT